MIDTETFIESITETEAFVPFPKEAIEGSIPARFEEIAQRFATKTAVASAHGGWTYRRLNEFANKIAHRISERLEGRSGERVIVLLEKGPECLAGIMGVLKSGNAYVPVDPDFPADRNRHILEDSNAALVVTNNLHGALAEELTRKSSRLLDIDADLEDASSENPGTTVSPDAPAYLIYTSGSTGKPKGVLQNHRNTLHLCWRRTELQKLCSEDRMTLFYSCSVMGSVYCIFGSLLNGASLHPYDIRKDGLARLGLWLERERITVYHSVASVFRHFAATAESSHDYSNIRLVIFGGERSLVSDVQKVRATFSESCEIITGLGSTETGTVRRFAIRHNTPIEGKIVPIGYPVDDMEVLLLDEEGNEVPQGQIGEICIRSRYNALEYWNRPEDTAKAFVPDPDDAGVTTYHSGDMGVIAPDGLLTHQGRKDFQVKVRGFRIEIAEIELTLLEVPGVGEAVVIASEDQNEETSLVAYFVERKGADTDLRGIRSHLQSKLPYYMIPAVFVRLDEIPLTPNGKINRKALPPPAECDNVLRDEYVPPRSETETRLAKIWSEVTDASPVGANHNFFALGGHSLSATRALSRISAEFGVDVPFREFLDAPDLEHLASTIDQRITDTSISQRQQIIHSATREPAPLSFAQTRMWLLDRITPGSAAYNISNSVRLDGPLDTAALEWAINEIIRRHEILRTTFEEIDGEPRQRVHPFKHRTLECDDCAGMDQLEIQRRVEANLQEFAQSGYDLAKGPLIRFKLLKESDDSHVLLININHIVYDNIWSSGLFFQELAECYEARCRDRDPNLPKLDIQYSDYARWQHEQGASEKVADELAYWKQKLENPPAMLELPTDHPRPATPTRRGGLERIRFPVQLQQALNDLSRQHDTTLFMTLVAAWSVLLARYSHQDDILIGTPIGNRDQIEIEPLIGLFINTLVLRSDLSADPSFSDLLKSTKTVCLEAFDNRTIPFEELVRQLHTDRGSGANPFFQVLFIFQSGVKSNWKLPGLKLTPLESHAGGSKFDLTLSLAEEPDGLHGYLEYDRDLFLPATIRRMVANLEVLFGSIAANPGARISELEYITVEEKTRVIETWNDTGRTYPDDMPFIRLFEKRAASNRNACATVSHDGRLTYQQLNSRSNELAHYLIRQGVKPGSLIGISMKRSNEMLVALLGIMKAGAAYVPLDPDFPADRLAMIVEDTRLDIILTESRLRNLLPGGTVKHLCLDQLRQELDDMPSVDPDVRIAPADLAYVIFTSGSTGRPKGVKIPHRAVTNFLVSMRSEPGLDPSDRLLAVTTISFDISTLELFLPLITGARMEILTREQAMDGRVLLDRIERHGITFLQATPATWRVLLDAGWKGSPKLKVLVGGEALPKDLAELLTERAGEVWNMYGPTETTVWSTCAKVTAHVERISVGHPIANTQIYMLDSALRPTPIGVPGELCIGGDGVAAGYWERPDLTGDRFVPDPFRNGGNAMIYRTGDQARFTDDGSIEFLGRMDNQVKVRGFRIELGEIETVLAKHEAVRQCAVAARNHPSGEKVLVAYVVPEAESGLPMNSIMAALQKHLPGYMVPSIYESVDSLPQTANGKLDRKRLPEPRWKTQAAESRDDREPTDTERRLMGLWENLLKVQPVGLTRNFFALGGSSLLAVKLFAEIQTEFGKDLPLILIFEHPTVESLAKMIDDYTSTTDRKSLLPLSSTGTSSPLFCFHGTGAHAYIYSGLAQELLGEVPVVGVQGEGFDGRPISVDNMHDMVASYVEQMIAYHPEGPFHLAGFCAGGAIAYEAAQQLTSRGREVALLFLVECVNRTVHARQTRTMEERLSGHARNLRSRGLRHILQSLKTAIGNWSAIARDKASRIVIAICVQFKLTVPALLRGVYINDAYKKIVHNYAPKPIKTDAVCFKSPLNKTDDPYLGWQHVIEGKLTSHEVGENHHIWMYPYVREYAPLVRDEIMSAEARLASQNEQAV